ncbi:MAG: PspC domain-containing protein [Arachnia sp.]
MSNLVDLGALSPRLRGLERPVRSGITPGVCRALASGFGVDPLVVRVLAVLLTMVLGIGLPLYLWIAAITPRSGGEPPILSWLPAFAAWSRWAQAAVILGTSGAFVIFAAPFTGVSWPILIVAVIVAWWMRRRSRATSATYPPTSSMRVPTGTAPVDGVTAWRRNMAAHSGGSDLPVVDLYAPEPVTSARTQGEAEHPRVSWVAAGVILGLAAASAGIAVATGLAPPALWALTLGAGTAGLGILAWSLARRRNRRLPTMLLVLTLSAVAAAGILAFGKQDTVPMSIDESGDHHYIVDAENLTIDLSDLAVDEAIEVIVEADVSKVTVILPGSPENMITSTDMSHVEVNIPEDSPETLIDLTIEADLSDVIVEVAES